MGNPFDDDSRSYLALVNDEGQYSLWPADIAIPAGWSQAMTADSRAACLAYIEETWTDMRPRSLVEAMDGDHVRVRASRPGPART